MSEAKAVFSVAVDDGTREVVLVNTFGKEICKVHFRPSDLSIMDRYKDLMASFEDIVRPLTDLDIKNDGTATTDEDWAVLKRVETELKKRINALFDMDADEADLIFATRNPFSSVGGQFFVQRVLDALSGVIEQAMAEELKASEERTKKYLKDAAPAKKPTPTKKPAAKSAKKG